jgi:hypothetical protein
VHKTKTIHSTNVPEIPLHLSVTHKSLFNITLRSWLLAHVYESDSSPNFGVYQPSNLCGNLTPCHGPLTTIMKQFVTCNGHGTAEGALVMYLLSIQLPKIKFIKTPDCKSVLLSTNFIKCWGKIKWVNILCTSSLFNMKSPYDLQLTYSWWILNAVQMTQVLVYSWHS